MTQDKSKQFEIKLDHEQKVIMLGSSFYDLKGVLICEATEEDKKRFYCGRFATFPIVDDIWSVMDDYCISEQLESVVVGKKGDTILLDDLRVALSHNADVVGLPYSNVLLSLEKKGITISNKKSLNSDEELSDTIVLVVEEINEDKGIYTIATLEGYFIPSRLCMIGKDGELYLAEEDLEGNQHIYTQTIVDLIAEEVYSLCWFFHKPNLRVLLVARLSRDDKNVKPIPDDWAYAVKNLESDINKRIEKLVKNIKRYHTTEK